MKPLSSGLDQPPYHQCQQHAELVVTAVSWTSPPVLIVCGGRDEQDEPNE